jgi:putative endonuclease
MHYAYIVFLSNKTLYTGSTGDIKRRLIEHKNGKVRSTSFSSVHRLIHLEMYLSKSDAQRREKFLKTTEGKRLLRQQIRDVLKQIQYRE